ncbi:MAG: hypothetical protein LOY03_00295 [Cyclobacteriaceae bacterium]|jgi:hypothetical protein|nr:hypothetical protein [Cyclobacteriaceae bacterium]
MKTYVALTAILAACFCHVHAQPENSLSTSLETRFAADFPDATNTRWTHTSNVTLASFLSKGEVYVAYYDAKENPIATARRIMEPTLLPLLVRQALGESCQRLGGDIKMGPIFELVIAHSTQYIVSVEGPKMTYTFKFDTMGNRAVLKKGPTRRYGEAIPAPYLARDPRF